MVSAIPPEVVVLVAEDLEEGVVSAAARVSSLSQDDLHDLELELTGGSAEGEWCSGLERERLNSPSQSRKHRRHFD